MGLIETVLRWRFAAQMRSLKDALQKVSTNFEVLIAQHSKKSKGVVPAQYTLRFSAARQIGYREKYPGIYWETKFGFILLAQETSGKVPVAVIGFDISGKHIIVRQLQGMKGMKEQLRMLRWEPLLYRSVVLFGREAGFRSVHVCSARQSEYYPFKEGISPEDLPYAKCLERAKRFELVYEKIPRRCGFILNALTQRHVFTLVQ